MTLLYTFTLALTLNIMVTAQQAFSYHVLPKCGSSLDVPYSMPPSWFSTTRRLQKLVQHQTIKSGNKIGQKCANLMTQPENNRIRVTAVRYIIRGAQGAPRNSDMAALSRGQFSGPHKRFSEGTERFKNCLHGQIYYYSVAALPTGTAAAAAHLRFAMPWHRFGTNVAHNSRADSVSKNFFSWISLESQTTWIPIFRSMDALYAGELWEFASFVYKEARIWQISCRTLSVPYWNANFWVPGSNPTGHFSAPPPNYHPNTKPFL